MKTPACLLAITAALAFSAFTYAAPADDLAAAVKKLAAAPNYSWTTTTEMANSQFPAMPADGVAEKDGFSIVTRNFNGNNLEITGADVASTRNCGRCVRRSNGCVILRCCY
jgi:hypothetical protein